MNLLQPSYYKPAYSGPKKFSLLFLGLICLLVFAGIFGLSGAADLLNYNEWASYLVLVLFVFCKKKGRIFVNLHLKYYIIASVSIMTLLILIHYDSTASQLINLVSTFGIILFAEIFSKIEWEKKDLFKLGIVCGTLGLFLLYLLLPGYTFSGWNTNSCIIAIPVIFVGMCFLRCTEKNFALIIIVPIFFLAFSMVSQLANRSSLVTLLLFTGMIFFYPFIYRRKFFRWFYILIILLNVVTPFFYSIIVQSDLFNDLLGFTASLTESGKMGEGGFNGRETLWVYAIKSISEHPFFGLYGIRPIYPHNLSMDLLVEFGWIGWLTFMGMVVYLLEYTFREGSIYNLFLIGFLCVIFLNTFENVFTCCDILSFFPYIFIGIALRINKDISPT